MPPKHEWENADAWVQAQIAAWPWHRRLRAWLADHGVVLYFVFSYATATVLLPIVERNGWTPIESLLLVMGGMALLPFVVVLGVLLLRKRPSP